MCKEEDRTRIKCTERRCRRKGRGMAWTGKVTFGEQGPFVVTFSHLCSSLMPGQCAGAHLSPAFLTSLLLLLLLLPLNVCLCVCLFVHVHWPDHYLFLTQNADSFHISQNKRKANK